MKTMACAAIVAAFMNTCSGFGGSGWDDTPTTPNYDNSPLSPGTKTVKTYKYTVPGIPAEQYATDTEAPVIDGNTVEIPNFTPSFQTAEGHEVINLILPGIKDVNGKYIQFFGTFTNEQNIWMDVDGTPRSISLYNVFDGQPTYQENKCECSFIPEFKQPAPDPEDPEDPKPMVDVVFLVDNSDSMGDEADGIATQLEAWAEQLSQTVDVQFGCVGYHGEGHGSYDPTPEVLYGYISGAIDITTVDKLAAWLNRAEGAERTKGFDGNMKEDSRYNTVGECGVAALRYALDKFHFRTNSAKIFINLTDEPTQCLTAEKSEFGTDWVKNHKEEVGTIYTIFSGPVRDGKSSLNEADYTYFKENGDFDWAWHVVWESENPGALCEHPEVLSEITGGTVQYATPDWQGGELLSAVKVDVPTTVPPVVLPTTDVSLAIENMHVISFVNEPDLVDGKEHEVTIYIMTKDGLSYGTRTYSVIFKRD
jgi:hypothetical protein